MKKIIKENHFTKNSTKFELPISVSARVIYQLGEELISDEFVALGELIKNAYDADCRKVTIKVDTKTMTSHGQGRIIISDNGNGMLPSILENSFLRISTHFKKVEKFSPYYNRRTLGNKGLGRLSIQRLGHHVTVHTTPRMERLAYLMTEKDKEICKTSNEFHVQINWLDFRDNEHDSDLSSVKASIEYKYLEDPKLGTRLIIEGIRNLNFWKIDRKTETRIKSEIFGMVNPFLQNKEQRFKVFLEIDNKRITNEDIEENLLSLVSDVEVDFSLNNWELEISILNKRRYLERLASDTIRNMKNVGFLEYKIIKPYTDMKKTYKINLLEDYTSELPYLEKIEMQSYYDTNLGKKIEANPGNFNGKLYASDLSPSALTEDKAILDDNGYVFNTVKEIRSILNSSRGVYLFRNDFRILPYGPDIDWFKFTYRSQRLKATIYKEHTVSGYVNLDSQTSEGLQEQTNRQGLIEDEYGSNFLNIIQNIVSFIAFREDIDLRKRFNVPISKSTKIELKTMDGNIVFTRTKANLEEKKKLLNDLEKETEKIYTSPEMKLNSTYKKIAQSIEVLKTTAQKEEEFTKQERFRYEQEITQLKSLVGLAGQGIIVESLTHELNKIESNISSYARNSKKLLISDLSLNENDIKNLGNYQDSILHEISFLQLQLKHLEPTYKKNRTVLSQISIKTLLNDLYRSDGPMANKAKNIKMQVIIEGDDFEIKGNKGVLITIFDNLFLNSLYWVNQEANKDKEIQFELNQYDKTITIWDSGPGFHKNIINKLFEPYESMKPDGRGLGLYIVKELIRSLHGVIEIDKHSTNNRGNYYKLKVQFPSSDSE
ncbi:ATP-binding protein [Alkalihalobacillus oceani]|uniref:histidine kinase n=1 Tax=Halalkalibacter oceani TaxID=1653776 RepID=A0A9X2IQ35_9BACI|nr:sensor histidine kinase [Halalkalibacter oceani]MCM3715865.1 ATP-binding protein [Halalkalibacter oceani]